MEAPSLTRSTIDEAAGSLDSAILRHRAAFGGGDERARRGRVVSFGRVIREAVCELGYELTRERLREHGIRPEQALAAWRAAEEADLLTIRVDLDAIDLPAEGVPA
jgi:hypothetical protein